MRYIWKDTIVWDGKTRSKFGVSIIGFSHIPQKSDSHIAVFFVPRHFNIYDGLK